MSDLKVKAPAAGRVDVYPKAAQPELEATVAVAPEKKSWLSGVGERVGLGPDTKSSFRSTLSNDNLDQVPGLRRLMPVKDRVSAEGIARGDDDGETFGLGAEQLFTDETTGKQVAVIVNYELLTEQGALANPGQHLDRVDMVELLVARNSKTPIAPGTMLVTGAVLGAQATGDFGGLELQEGFHRAAAKYGMGGRTQAGGLQNHYTQSTPQITPVIGAGVAIEWNGKAGPFNVTADAQATAKLALGQGISAAEVRAGGSVRLPGAMTLEAHATAGVSRAQGAPLEFIQPKGLKLGYELQLKLDALNARGIPVTPFVAVRRGGAFDDTVMTLGLTIGLDSKNWLKPPR